MLHPIPPALRDRMEVLEIPGYTEEEKLAIARDHLVQKQIVNHGLTSEQIAITDEAIRAVIHGYTREAGVRNLEREIGALCRKAPAGGLWCDSPLPSPAFGQRFSARRSHGEDIDEAQDPGSHRLGLDTVGGDVPSSIVTVAGSST